VAAIKEYLQGLGCRLPPVLAAQTLHQASQEAGTLVHRSPILHCVE
ncbi:hypothetical protein MTO96_050094, partial [Rhipicephalus appendiculatus]